MSNDSAARSRALLDRLGFTSWSGDLEPEELEPAEDILPCMDMATKAKFKAKLEREETWVAARAARANELAAIEGERICRARWPVIEYLWPKLVAYGLAVSEAQVAEAVVAHNSRKLLTFSKASARIRDADFRASLRAEGLVFAPESRRAQLFSIITDAHIWRDIPGLPMTLEAPDFLNVYCSS